METGKQGDKEPHQEAHPSAASRSLSPLLPFSPSPFLPFSLSPLLLVCLCVLINLPILSPAVIFSNDTLFNVSVFHTAYSELYFCDELPRWIPLMAYGVPADFYLFTGLQPTDYMVMAFGWLVGAKDVLVLYKISMILSQIIFVLGLYILARKLFRSMVPVLMVSVGGLLTNTWMFDCLWSFTVFYILPWVFWLLLNFLETGKPAQLWLAGCVATLSLLGTISYIAPVHLLIYLSFLLPFFWCEPRKMLLFVRWRNFVHPLFVFFVAFLGLLAAWILSVDVVFLATGRDAATGRVPLGNFLNEARQPLAALATMFIKGDFYYGEAANYIGILPLATFVYALIRGGNRPAFFAFLTVALVLLWLFAGGWFAVALYKFFPLMSRFHIISPVWNIMKVPLLFLGGFGLDRLVADLSGTSLNAGGPTDRRIRWLIIALVLLCAADLLAHRKKVDWTDARLFSYKFETNEARPENLMIDFSNQSVGLPFIMARFLAYACVFACVLGSTLFSWRASRVSGRSTPPAHAGGSPGSEVAVRGEVVRTLGVYLLLIVYLVDVGLFQWQTLKNAPYCPPGISAGDTFHARSGRFTPQRFAGSLKELPEQPGRIFQVLGSERGPIPQNSFLKYMAIYPILGADPVCPRGRIDLVTPGIHQMFLARGGSIDHLDGFELPKNDPGFRHLLGDHMDKVRIVRNARFEANVASAIESFRSVTNPQNTIVIVGAEPPPNPRTAAEKFEEDAVDVIHFSANRMTVRVRAKAPGWLLDADAYDPSWQATVTTADDLVRETNLGPRPATVVRANLGFKAVHVEAGETEVTFFHDGGWRIWAYRGVVACAMILTVFLWCMIFFNPGPLPNGFRPPAGTPGLREYIQPRPPKPQGEVLRGVSLWSSTMLLVTATGGFAFYPGLNCFTLLILGGIMLTLILVSQYRTP